MFLATVYAWGTVTPEILEVPFYEKEAAINFVKANGGAGNVLSTTDDEYTEINVPQACAA